MTKNTIQQGYKTPEKHSFEEFKTGCILVPLTEDFKFDKWKGNGAKVNKENLRNFLREGITAHNPGSTKKQVEKIIDEAIENFIESVKGFLNPLNPCVAVAYPLNNIWIVSFLTEVFTEKKANGENKILIDSATLGAGMKMTDITIKEMKELNYDPYFYTYTIMQRASENQGLEEVYQRSQEELERLEELKNQN